MGLGLLIVIMKAIALKTGNEIYNNSARFWAKIFAINFAIGVVTGIPMEFQFGTNWARFSTFAGGVIGQTLAMEGVFAFFLESSFLGLFLFGECIFLQRSWSLPVPGFPDILSLLRTLGCSILLHLNSVRTEVCR
jgi:cytochrome bd-type quinol oxidase subunit 1